MPKPNSSTLTFAQVNELLSYDPLTGDILWKKSGRGRRSNYHAGTMDVRGCWCIGIGRPRYKAHRIAWLLAYGVWPEHEIDHINGNPADNRLVNLRDVPHRTNQQNQHRATSSNKSTGTLGVSRTHNRTKFVAQIKVSGKHLHLGCFDDVAAAQSAYLEAKRRLHEGNML
jgi:HNH endonuclease